MKLFALIVAAAMVLALAACGDGEQSTTQQASAVDASEPDEPSKTRQARDQRGRLKMSPKEIAQLSKLTIAKQSAPPPRRIKVIDVREGSGAAVRKTDAVLVRWFQVRYPEALKRSRTGLYGPQKFGMNEVVKGWLVGLPGMKVGGRRILMLPPKLVYPRWQPSWGYAPYCSIYVIDLLGISPGGAGSF